MQRSNTVFLRVIKIKISKIRLSVALHRRGELILCVFVRACAFACMRMCVCLCVCLFPCFRLPWHLWWGQRWACRAALTSARWGSLSWWAPWLWVSCRRPSVFRSPFPVHLSHRASVCSQHALSLSLPLLSRLPVISGACLILQFIRIE